MADEGKRGAELSKKRKSSSMSPGRSGASTSKRRKSYIKEDIGPSLATPPASTAGKRPSVSEDAMYLLRAVVDFKKRTGSAPTKSTIADFVGSVKSWMAPEMNFKQIFNKIRHLRFRFGNEKHSSDPKEILARQLAAEAWPRVIKTSGRPSQAKKEKKKNVLAVEVGNGHPVDEGLNEALLDKIKDVSDIGFGDIRLGEFLPCMVVALEICCREMNIVHSSPTLEEVITVNGLSKMKMLEEQLEELFCEEMKLLSEKLLIKEILLKRLVTDHELACEM